MEPEARLAYEYGPTETDPDPGKMWHADCGGEVYAIEDRLVCDCGAESPS